MEDITINEVQELFKNTFFKNRNVEVHVVSEKHEKI